MIPILYEKNEKLFTTLGMGVLADIINPIVREERNGLFEMEFDYPINSPLFMSLRYSRIVVADASPKLKNQRFVIVRIEAKSDGMAHVYCEHISQFVTKNTTLKPIVNDIDVNAGQALDNWNKNLLGDVNFMTTSDITNISSVSWNISKIKNARAALGGVEGSILDKFGGEYYFNNMLINLMRSRGQNLGAYIAYGKNLTSLTQDLEIENTYTSIQPYVVYIDPIETADANGKVTTKRVEKTLVLTEHILHSDYVGNYTKPLVKTVEFDAKDVMAPEVITTYKDANGKEVRKTAEQIQEERLKRLKDSEINLRNKGLEYIKANKIGIPRVKINLTFADLASSIEYKGIAKTEEINLCDYVTIDFLKLGINRVTAQVVRVEYNPRLERYEKLTIGEVGSKFQSSVMANKATIDDVKNQLGVVQENLNQVMVSADGMTLTFFGPDEPIAQNINDKWYKDLGGGDTELRIWDGTMWKFILSTRDISEAKKAADDALVKINEAEKNAATKDTEIQDKFTAIEDDIADNYSELSGKVVEVNNALQGKVDSIYVDQKIDEKTGTITQTIGQIETKVNELDAVPVYTIGADGYWYKDGVKTSSLAVGKDGQSGAGFTWNLLKNGHLDFSKIAYSVPNHIFLVNRSDAETEKIDNTILKFYSNALNSTQRLERRFTSLDIGKYTYSVRVRFLNTSLTSGVWNLGQYVVHERKEEQLKVGEWQTLTLQFEVTEKTTSLNVIRFYLPNLEIGASVEFDWEKLERGVNNNPTWSPHVTEIQGANGKDAMFMGATPPTDTTIAWLDTNTNQIKRYYNGAWRDINEAIITKLNTVTDTVDKHEQTIGQISTDLANKLDTSTFTTFKQEYNQIVSTVQKTETKINNINISDRNLLLKSNYKYQNSDYNIVKYDLATDTLIEGETVTLVVKASLGAGKTDIIAYNSGALVANTSLILKREHFDEYGIGVVTGKWTKTYNSYSTDLNNQLWICVRDSSVNVESTIFWAKLVRGNTTSREWTRPLEEQTTVAAFSQFKLSTEENYLLLKNNTTGLFSAITQQPGEMFLQAGNDISSSKIHLTKDNVYIDNALITNAMIADGVITRAKIGDGAINTAKIADASITSAKIINLDVLKVSGLSSEFIRSKWNAINSSVQIDGNGMYVDGDWGGAINFTRRGLTYYDKIKGQVMAYNYGLYRNLSDPLINSQMAGIGFFAEQGYSLRLGIRKEITNQNTSFMEIFSATDTTTYADIHGEMRIKSGIRLGGNVLYANSTSASGIKVGYGQALGNWVTTITNAEGTAGIGFTQGGGIMVRRFDSSAGISAWKWL